MCHLALESYISMRNMIILKISSCMHFGTLLNLIFGQYEPKRTFKFREMLRNLIFSRFRRKCVISKTFGTAFHPDICFCWGFPLACALMHYRIILPRSMSPNERWNPENKKRNHEKCHFFNISTGTIPFYKIYASPEVFLKCVLWYTSEVNILSISTQTNVEIRERK